MKSFWITYIVCMLLVLLLSAAELDVGGFGIVAIAFSCLTTGLFVDKMLGRVLRGRSSQIEGGVRKHAFQVSIAAFGCLVIVAAGLATVTGRWLDRELGVLVFVSGLFVALGVVVHRLASITRYKFLVGFSGAILCLGFLYLWSFLALVVTGR